MNSDPSSVRAIATALFDGVPGGALQKLRPLICPFDQLAQEVPVGSRVLDVGCGSGLFLGLLAGLGRIDEATGFDSNGGAIQRALQMRKRLPRPARLEFERRDVADGWPEGMFDVVSIIDVMHHVPPEHQASLIATAAQKLRPGGRLLYKDMVRRPLWRASMNRLHDLVLARDWIHYAPIEDVKRWMTQAGLRHGALRSTNMFWYGHELLVAQRPG